MCYRRVVPSQPTHSLKTTNVEELVYQTVPSYLLDLVCIPIPRILYTPTSVQELLLRPLSYISPTVHDKPIEFGSCVCIIIVVSLGLKRPIGI